jgi:tRNA A-37 threonylcarbamoyl transferase component Bud32
LDKQRKERRDRLVALSFVSVLLVLIYGPAAPWFVAADRILYDQMAGHVGNAPLENGLIVSIHNGKLTPDETLDQYGKLIQTFKYRDIKRIILADPPEIAASDDLPGWAATLSSGVPVYVPKHHRLAHVASKSGFLDIAADGDGVFRRSALWKFDGGLMSPSLPLAIAIDNPDVDTDPRVSGADDAIYLSNYAALPRLTAREVLDPGFDAMGYTGATIFIDAAPPIVAATAILPSGQFVTHSEITAALLANIEQRRSIIAPAWVKALEVLVPALLAIVAVLFMPGRMRRDIIVISATTVVSLVFIEALLLAVFRVRLDLGRPIFIFLGVGLLSWWLAGAVGKAAVDAYKRGVDFLAAGRLEPAFAEFRRCEPTESLATVMYKLSLAFEEQAKPERAEAVLDWMKRTHGPGDDSNGKRNGKNGPPQRLGRYVIERKIGRGAMGAVYLAKDPRINRSVALKVIPIEKEFEDEELEEARLRFFREAESAGRLTHPNIITVYDAGEDQHLAYIAMEYQPGDALTKYADPKRLLAPGKALELCARTAEALDYAHNQGVIHRDIKPANILYNVRDDTLKISDFGVARLTDNNRTKTGIVLGTPMYMSPEQLNAEELSGHSDLFSLGVTLYELLVGEVPFRATNIAVLMTKITTEDPAPLSNRRPGIPPSVDSVLAKALAKRPRDRFVNGGEMSIALRNCAKYASTS